MDATGRVPLELHLTDLRQLFNSLDPAPFRERDLDPAAEAYIVDWAREVPRGVAPSLVVHLADAPAAGSEAMLRDAVHGYFLERAQAERGRLRQLFRTGRVSLVIGLAFLAGAIALGEFIASFVAKEGWAYIVKETFVIGGWVALWRPLEIFLYDWWPIRAEASMYDRLGAMPVTMTSGGAR